MRKIHAIIVMLIAVMVCYYVIAAFLLQQQAVNKQAIYVHLQPEWVSYPSNIVYDITNVWTRTGNAQLDSKARLAIAKESNPDQLYWMHEKSYVLVRQGNSECHDDWEPHYARFGADVIRHQIEYLSGLQSSPDPNITMYNAIPSNQDQSEHESQIKSGYSQFIPICTEKETTSFDYSIRINDNSVGFDVYFVPSIQEQAKHDKGERFQYYADGTCFGKNYASFSGTCYNVGKDAGLLIIIPDNLSLPLTKLDVWLYEK